MHLLPESANKLIDEFSRLPGIGNKTTAEGKNDCLPQNKMANHRAGQ